MDTMANDEINERISAGRQAIGIHDPDQGTAEMEPQRVPTAVIAAGIGVALVGVGLLGWWFYRSRRRRNLIEQIRASLPDRMRDARDLGDQIRTSLPDRMRDARELSDQIRGSVPGRMRDARALRDDLMERLRKVV
jgi:hypothetical protein